MTSTSGQPSMQAGTSASIWARPGGSGGPGGREWRREGEPGSAFRGLSRGRGGGRPPRGGRGGRGGSTPAQRNNESVITTNTVPLASQQRVPSISSTASPQVTSSASTATGAKSAALPKTTRRPSRKASMSTDVSGSTSTPAAPSAPALDTTAARPGPRRRRSHQHNRTSSVSVPKASLSAQPSISSLSRPPPHLTINVSESSKDPPPHLSAQPEIPTFDMRANIDTLVERVRAIAMADPRPVTPGMASHIDWAGDDDDSLPDLDDWGVTTGTSTGDQDEEIPPILEQTSQPRQTDERQEDPGTPLAIKLKSVPKGPPLEAVEESKEKDRAQIRGKGRERRKKTLESPEGPSQRSGNAAISAGDTDNVDTSGTPITPQPNQKVIGTSSTKSSKVKGSSSPILSSLAPEFVPSLPRTPPKVPTPLIATSSSVIAKPGPPVRLSVPLHPSLPPKPVTCFDAKPARGLQSGLNPRSQLPQKPFVVPVESVLQPAPATSSSRAQTGAQTAASQFALNKNETEQRLGQSIPTSSGSLTAITPPSQPESRTENGGLVASIHAPKPVPVSIPSAYTLSPTFHPTHNRAHTVGHSSFIPVPLTAPATSPSYAQSSLQHSRTATPQRQHPPLSPVGTGGTHMRTHSSPPTGSSHTRTPSATRPVISLDAISRLSKTLKGNCAVAPSKREHPLLPIPAADL